MHQLVTGGIYTMTMYANLHACVRFVRLILTNSPALTIDQYPYVQPVNDSVFFSFEV